MTDRRGAWLEIDLDAIRHNLGLIRSVVGDAAVGQVVKAEAYGHGMIEVSRAIEPIVDALCVATLDEAITLRPQVGSRIIMLYPVPHPAVAEALEYDIELPVMSAADLEAIQAAARPGRPPVRVHLGVETGMGRGGLQPENVVAVAAAGPRRSGVWSWPGCGRTCTAPRIRPPPTGSCSVSTSPPRPCARRASRSRPDTRQPRAASSPVTSLRSTSCGPAWPPTASSTRACPSRQMPGRRPPSCVRPWPSRLGRSPSVGSRRVARSAMAAPGVQQRPSRIAVLPVGYGDGYLRSTQPGAEVLVRGRRIPLVGRVSMDAVTVDVTDLPGLDYSEEFVLLGSQGEETITAGELARRRNTIAWEVLTSMAQRLARVYHPLAGTADRG